MDVVELDGVDSFLERAAPVLLADEARHNLALGICTVVRTAPDHYPGARFWVVEDGEVVVGAALRTPPHYLVLAQPLAAGADAELGRAVDDLPGVVGALPEVESFANAWAEHRRGRWRRRTAMRFHALDTVRFRGEASGAMREASRADRTLAVAWWRAFMGEATRDDHASRGREESSVDLRLEAEDGGIALWEKGGEVVSLAGYGSPTPHGIRVGPVYTPPERRGRGYATALVARLSERLLAEGRRFCFLSTDLANPTSNRIYARIGYEPVCDTAEIALET